MHRRNTYGVTAYFCIMIFCAYFCIFKFAYNGIFILVHISAYFCIFKFAYNGIFILVHISACYAHKTHTYAYFENAYSCILVLHICAYFVHI